MTGLSAHQLAVIRAVQAGAQTSQDIRRVLLLNNRPTSTIKKLVDAGYLSVVGQRGVPVVSPWGTFSVRQNLYAYTGKNYQVKRKETHMRSRSKRVINRRPTNGNRCQKGKKR